MGYLIILIILIAVFAWKTYQPAKSNLAPVTSDAAAQPVDEQTKALIAKIGASPDLPAEDDAEVPQRTDYTADQSSGITVQ